MPAKRKHLKIPLKVFLTDNYSRFASKFPFLKERQIKAKLHQAWRKQCQTLEGREADTPKIEKRRIETISLLSEGKANFKPINFFPCNITLRSGETLSLIIQAYNKSAMSFAKMEDLYKQIAWTNFDILKFRLGTEAWGKKNQRKAEPQDDFFCFIPPSLGAKSELLVYYSQLSLVKTVVNHLLFCHNILALHKP